MIVALCFHSGDQELTLKNVQWWNELGGCHGHEVLVGYDPLCPPDITEAIRLELVKCFDKVYKCEMQAQIDGWPAGANYFFKRIATWLQGDPAKWPYFFWMEPDAIPLREGWLNELETAYKRGAKPFMGDRVQVGDIPLHMSGVGVYQNPIYLLAGECYRAHDIAWDMAAKDQIVPNAYFTELIEHAWKHPTFHDLGELGTQIAPQTLLFHSSKDGSLIDLLRQKRRGNNSVPLPSSASKPAALPTSPKEPDPQPGSPSPLPCPICHTGHPIGQHYAYDIFIRTYPGDYDWLQHCLVSIHKFCKGFRKVWIISPEKAPDWVEILNVEWKVLNDETDDGYLAQQITKLYADVLTDYQSDYILHVDSDVIFTRPVTPQDFFENGKVTWYYTPYSEIKTPWQPIVEKFMRIEIKNEFMRRLPMMIPRWLYPKLRENAYQNHKMPLCNYVKNQGLREFSEFNVLGAFAFIHHHDKFNWVNTTSVTMPEPFAKQFHSWSGLNDEIKLEIQKILGGAAPAALTGSIPVPPQVKVLPGDVWVLKNDQISQWVEQEGRLDHDQNLLPEIRKHIRPGASVVDIGAFIGDHTVAYAEAVGPAGMVYAFEPNPLAYTCLKHNTEALRNVTVYDYGLSNTEGTVPLSGNNGNAGGTYVGTHMKIADVKVTRLDREIPFGCDLIKIDVEGYELKVLEGAEHVINKYQPIIIMEINREALRRQGAHQDDIFLWLKEHGYQTSIIQENCCLSDPLYDILCKPAGVKAGSEAGRAETKSNQTETVSSRGSVVVLPTEQLQQVSLSRETLKDYVQTLADFADQSRVNRIMVMQRLSYAGLKRKAKK